MTTQTKGNLTRQSIKQALLRIQNNRPKLIAKERKISIASVAEEAGVSRATIYNNYPDIAERIRELNNTTNNIQRDEKYQASLRIESTNRMLRAEIQKLNLQLAKLASINACILIENTRLNALNNKNIFTIEK